MPIRKVFVINDMFQTGTEGRHLFDEFRRERIPRALDCDYFPFDPRKPMAPQVEAAVGACLAGGADLVLLDVYFGELGAPEARLGLTEALPKLVDAELPVIVLSDLDFSHDDALVNVTYAQQHGRVKYLSGRQLDKLPEFIASFNVIDKIDRASETFGFVFRFRREIGCRKEIERSFDAICKEFGSEPIEIPLAAPVSNFLGARPKPLGEKDSNKLFSSVTTDGRAMAVRYEGTALTAKRVAELASDRAWRGIRYHYFQEMVRVETSGDLDRSHYRAFYQAGLEAFSRDRSDHDKNVVDVLALTVRLLESLGLRPTLRLSHVRIVPVLLSEFGPEAFKRRRIIGALEREEDLDRVESILKICEVPNEHRMILLDLARARGCALEDGLGLLDKWGDRFLAARRELGEVVEELRSRDLERDCLFDPGIYRSLDFYSGITMQGDIPGQKECLGGGGYTGLVEAFGAQPVIHAFGMAIGVDRVVNVLLERRGE